MIDGVKCDEFTFTTTMNMAEVIGAQMPPEAAEAMKGLTMAMKGSMWVAKDRARRGRVRRVPEGARRRPT